MKFHLALVLFAVLLAGCNSKSELSQTQPVDEQGERATDSEAAEQQANELVNSLLIDGFYKDNDVQFQYPQGSQKRIMESAVGPIFIVYFAGGGGINFTLVKQDLSAEDPAMTLDEFTELCLNDFGTSLKDPEVLASGETKIDGRAAFERTWQGTRIDNEIVFATWQAWTIVDKTAYIFGVSGPADEIEAYRGKTQRIMDSIKFLAADD